MERSEPTLLSAAWKHRALVATIVAVSILLALLYSAVRGENRYFIGDVSIVLQDPSATLEGGGTGERFFAAQLEILRSPVVAEVAAEHLGEESPELEVTSTDLLESTSVSSSPESALVFLSVTEDDPERAVAMANAVAAAYQEVTRLRATQTSIAALERIDAQLDFLRERFVEVEQEIQEQRDANVAIRQLEEQFQEALLLLAELQAQLLVAEGDEAADLRQGISDLRGRIETYRLATGASSASPELQALVEEQDQLITRRADLLQRRDQIAIDAELAPGPVALLDPAEVASEVVETQMRRTLAVALVLGILAALAAAYLLELRRRSFGGRLEPESVLGAPLLADIPHFADESLDSRLPVRDAPRSAAAEAFRFAAASIEFAMRSKGARSVMMVGATLGHGKSTCLVNTAMANARQGHSVLLIDCDFGNQDTTRLVLDDETPPLLGLTDVVEADVPFYRGVTAVPLGNDVSLSLMSRGSRPTIAANLLRSKVAIDVFQEAKEDYDLVFVDAPPMLQVAYASTLANYVDALVVVVAHETPVRELEELVNRLGLIGTPVLGYLYNRSPLRREMTATEGSMVDVLGGGGDFTSGGSRRSWWQRIGS